MAKKTAPEEKTQGGARAAFTDEQIAHFKPKENMGSCTNATAHLYRVPSNGRAIVSRTKLMSDVP
jgi:hypothetical protein